MNAAQIKVAVAGLFFLGIFLSGFWLNHSGKPYGLLFEDISGGFTLTQAVAFSLTVRDVSGLACTEPRRGRSLISERLRGRLSGIMLAVGAALGRTGLESLGKTERAKAESPILQEFRDSAARNGYDPLLARAMVTEFGTSKRDTLLPPLKPPLVATF